jgi:hypothetical protein
MFAYAFAIAFSGFANNNWNGCMTGDCYGSAYESVGVIVCLPGDREVEGQTGWYHSSGVQQQANAPPPMSPTFQTTILLLNWFWTLLGNRYEKTTAFNTNHAHVASRRGRYLGGSVCVLCVGA